MGMTPGIKAFLVAAVLWYRWPFLAQHLGGFVIGIGDIVNRNWFVSYRCHRLWCLDCYPFGSSSGILGNSVKEKV